MAAQKNSLQRGFDNVAAAATSKALAFVGNTVLPFLGGLVGGAVGDWVGKNIRKILAGIAAFWVAQMAATFIMTVIAAVILVVFAAFAMFIINSGAYVVPPGRTGLGLEGGLFGPGIDVGASCPILGGSVLWGSMGTSNGSVQHGTEEYWRLRRDSCTSYTLGGCLCGQCATYGYAADFVYPTREAGPVYLPFIEGESVVWTVTRSWRGPRTGDGVGWLRAVYNGVAYEMYVSHLVDLPISGQSGDLFGVLVNRPTPHLHVELVIDGTYVQPDNMCQ